jgi:lipopolysaccharide/colanic/teichoic acid biosynthesis glycosyltransferase
MHAGRIARPPRRLGGKLRRGADLVVLLLVAPGVLLLTAVLALVVKLDSPGPAFVWHRRVGRAGRPFKMWKLRTMVEDAEERKKDLVHLNVLPWPDFKIPDDPRVTRVGRWLRKASLDEVPQLWNLFRGDVTLVGPRPCSVGVENYTLWQTERLEAAPGLLGEWQARGRNQSDFEDRCRMDISQARRASVGSDAALALRTLRAVLFDRSSS